MLQLSQTLSLGDEANGIVRVYPLPFAISAFLHVPETLLAFTLHHRWMECRAGPGDQRGGGPGEEGGGECGAEGSMRVSSNTSSATFPRRVSSHLAQSKA